MNRTGEKEYYFTLQNLTVGYDGTPLIRDITVSLKKGEILTLVGPNGGGKSTILKSIAGQLSVLGGCVTLDGADMAGMKRRIRAQKMALLLTRGFHGGHMSCRDVVAMGRYPYTGHFGTLTPKDRDIIEETMKMASVDGIGSMDFHRISDGQRQRVLLARAFCQQPEILILDEPTSYLDIRYKLEFITALENMRKKTDVTVIMSLHELGLARYVSDKVLCVEGEHIRYQGRAEEILTDETIRNLFGMDAGQYEKAKQIGLIDQRI